MLYFTHLSFFLLSVEKYLIMSSSENASRAASELLLENPLCHATDLGKPIPNTAHAISVALPLWSHVIGYEEGDAEIVDKMACGYPRFFVHPFVEKLMAQVVKNYGKPTDLCLLFPSISVAHRCIAYIVKNQSDASVTIATPYDGIFAVIFHESLLEIAKEFWRYAGDNVSSRQVEDVLEKRQPDVAAGQVAIAAIKADLARLYHIDSEDVYLFPTGMTASYMAQRILTHCFPGLKTCQLGFPYVDVLRVQKAFGTGVHFFNDVADVSQVEKLLITEKLAGVYTEFTSNPLLNCTDLPALSTLLKKYKVPLVVDDTIATVVNSNVIAYGDLITTSLTKSYSGVGDVIAGSLVLNPASPFYVTFKKVMDELYECNLYSADAVVLARNGHDFEKRIQQINKTAQQLCEYLAVQSWVDEIYYPTISCDVLYQKGLKSGGGGAGLFSIVLKSPEENSPQFYDALQLTKGPSLGTNFTLCCPYTMLAHYDELEWVASIGVSPYLIRVSVGLESLSTLIARFDAASENINQESYRE